MHIDQGQWKDGYDGPEPHHILHILIKGTIIC